MKALIKYIEKRRKKEEKNMKRTEARFYLRKKDSGINLRSMRRNPGKFHGADIIFSAE